MIISPVKNMEKVSIVKCENYEHDNVKNASNATAATSYARTVLWN